MLKNLIVGFNYINTFEVMRVEDKFFHTCLFYVFFGCFQNGMSLDLKFSAFASGPLTRP